MLFSGGDFSVLAGVTDQTRGDLSALYGLPFHPKNDKMGEILAAEKTNRRIVRTYCDRCHCSCGVLVHVEDGKAVKVEGDPDCPVNEGALCPKGLSILQMVYHPDRIKQPLKRIGQRGEGRWQPISWEEAYDTTAARFNEVLAKYGSSTVTWSWSDAALHCHYLTKQAWLCAMNAPNHFHSDAHYCFHPVMIANKVTFGDFLTSETGPDYQNAKCIFLWGGNPAMSHPVAARNIMIGRRRGAKLIRFRPGDGIIRAFTRAEIGLLTHRLQRRHHRNLPW